MHDLLEDGGRETRRPTPPLRSHYARSLPPGVAGATRDATRVPHMSHAGSVETDRPASPLALVGRRPVRPSRHYFESNKGEPLSQYSCRPRLRSPVSQSNCLAHNLSSYRVTAATSPLVSMHASFPSAGTGQHAIALDSPISFGP